LGGDVEKVAGIVANHMKFHQLGQMRPTKRDRRIQEWTDMGIWGRLQVHGAADNMLEDFDLDNIQKSFKWN